MYLFSSEKTTQNIMSEGQQGTEALTAARNLFKLSLEIAAIIISCFLV